MTIGHSIHELVEITSDINTEATFELINTNLNELTLWHLPIAPSFKELNHCINSRQQHAIQIPKIFPNHQSFSRLGRQNEDGYRY